MIQWVGIGLIDGLIAAAFAYSFYEKRVRRGAHHEDAPPRPEPAPTPPWPTTPPEPAGARRVAEARTCAWLESQHPGWLVEHDARRGEYRARRDIDAVSPATAAAADPWELDRAISQYVQLAASLRVLTTDRAA